MLLRDHKPQAGQWAFRMATNRPFVTASVGPGAAGHNVARRGSLVFRQAADRAQPDRQEQPLPQQASEKQQAPTRALLQRRRPSASPFRKFAKSRQQTADSCAACGGRGFQIVEEVCLWIANAQTSAHNNSLTSCLAQVSCQPL